MNNKFMENIISMVSSNILIILSGIVSGFLVPKLLGVTDYGYYKVFNLYTTYTIFLTFGISNGVYMFYGGYKFEELPKEKMRLYFYIFWIIQIFSMLSVVVFSILFLGNQYRFIFCSLAIYIIAGNISDYFEKVSIMTGEFKYVVNRNATKSFLTVFIVFLLWIGIKLHIKTELYRLYIALFVGMYCLLSIQYVWTYRDIVLGPRTNLHKEKDNVITILKGGTVLLLANTVSSLIMNLDRQFVSMLFDINVYSIYSFAYSMLKIVILAISAISSVLYPTLKRMTHTQLKESYKYSIAIIGMISCLCLLGYYPLCWIVVKFLPGYMTSLPIFRILFPSIVISAVITMVMANHYIALQLQKKYFWYSITTLIVAFIINILSYIIFRSPIGFAVALVVTMMFWYIISDNYLCKRYKVVTTENTLYLCINSILFYLITHFVSSLILGFTINMLAIVLMTILFYKNDVHRLTKKFKTNND